MSASKKRGERRPEVVADGGHEVAAYPHLAFGEALAGLVCADADVLVARARDVPLLAELEVARAPPVSQAEVHRLLVVEFDEAVVRRGVGVVGLGVGRPVRVGFSLTRRNLATGARRHVNVAY
jgi:hypothetical protein